MSDAIESRVAVLEHIASETRDALAGIRTEIGGLRSEMRTEIGGLRTEIGGLRTEMRSDIGGLRSDIASLRTDNRVLATEVSHLKWVAYLIAGILAMQFLRGFF